MTKAELRAAYVKARENYLTRRRTGEYALHMDTLLSDYFGMPLAESLEDDLTGGKHVAKGGG